MAVMWTLVLFGVVAVFARPQDKYTDKYDHLDIDGILNNDRLYRKYFDCLVGQGKCTPEGKALKETLPEALATQCKRCSERQRIGADKVLKHMIEKRPEDWAVLERIFDPKGEYKKKFLEEEEKRGVKLD